MHEKVRGCLGENEVVILLRIGVGEKRYHTLEKKISILLLYWSIIMPILSGISFVPSAVKYGADFLWVGLAMCSIKKGRLSIRKNITPLVTLVVLLFAYAILIHLLHLQSILYFLWGFRNLFRFYIAFFAYANLMNERDIEKWFSFLDILFWVNIVFSVLQFLFLGIRQDCLGGIFGISGGTNGYTTALLCIVVVRHMCLSFEQKESLWKSMRICGASLLIAAMAELKAFFVLIVLIMVVTAALTKFSFKKVALMIAVTFAAFAASQILVYWFGFNNFFSISGVIEHALRESYSNSTAGDVNRLSAITTLNRLILKTPIERWFGLGLGNCDTASFAIFNTPFYEKYAHLHYTWFTAPKIYLEMGYVGLVLYIMFFVQCLLMTYKVFLQKKGNRIYCQMAIVMVLICCILSFYNASLSYEAAYILYFVLALPFIRQSNEDKAQMRTI